MGWGAAIAAVVNMIGQHQVQGQLDQTGRQIRRMGQQAPMDVFGPFGSAMNTKDRYGRWSQTGMEDPISSMFRQNVGGMGNYQLQGGLFNNPAFQDAFSQNDLSQSFGQAQAGNQIFMPGQFSGANMQGNVQNMFGQGMNNLQRAGDTSGLVQQNLDASRALAEPFETNARNNFFNTEFGKTMGATTGASNNMSMFGDAMLRADQNRVLGAQQLGQQQQQFLGGLGMQQIGQGYAGEQQGFNQLLQSLQQNQSAGQQRLGNAMGLFGMGRDTMNQGFGLGIQGQNANINQNQFWSNLMLGIQNADANRIGAQTGTANALAQLGSNSAGSQGGFMSGISDMIKNWG